MSVETPIIKLRDVELVPIALEDADEQYWTWLNDIEVIRLLEVARQDRSRKAMKEYIAGTITDPNRHFFKIVARDIMSKVGTISLSINPIHRIAHYGYLIGEREFWGGDVALQAQVGLFDYAFRTLNMRKVAGGACTNNIGSNFNFRRLGFQREGVRRAQVFIGTEGEETADIADYGCLAEEWIATSEKFDKFRRP
jgi:[ribosomal protein S5]-alanine N-acetyltransferase